jgi:uncharacterized protein
MLQEHLLAFRRISADERSATLVPDWLTSRDEVWLRAMVEELDALVGQPAFAVGERLRDAVAPLARRHGAGFKRALAAWTVERRRWRSRVASPVKPEKIRKTLFSLKVGRSRSAALDEAARLLGLEHETIEASLFADRKRCRVLVAPAEPASPADLVHRYNLALAQGLLLRSTEVHAVMRAHARSVVRYAKLHGLMATFESQEDAVSMALSGPLALFHETTKYGRALAGILPSLAATPGWSLRARVLLHGESHVLALDASAPLPRTHALPATSDSLVEKQLAKDLRRARSGWELVREDTVVRVGRRLFFPDFTLVAPGGRGRVLVEIVGYWDPTYLANKVDALAAVDTPIIVCVDERHATGALSPGPRVLPYRGNRVDAAALVRAADGALASC